MRLYDITEQYVRLLALADESDEDFSDALDGLEDELEAKADNMAAVVRMLDVQAEAAKAEAARLVARAKALEARAQRVRAALLHAMDAAGQPKLAGARFTVSARNSAARVEIVDESTIPVEFVEVVETRRVNKAAIKAAIKAANEEGEVRDGVVIVGDAAGYGTATVPGVEMVRGRTLQIR
jgi:hypothetical protein